MPKEEQEKKEEKVVESEAIKQITAEFRKIFNEMKTEFDGKIKAVEEQNAKNLRAIVSGAKTLENEKTDDDEPEVSREERITENLRKHFKLETKKGD